MDFEGKVVVVTGSSRGIGREIAVAFALAGGRVACVATSLEGSKATSDAIGGYARPYACDVSDSASVEALFASVGLTWAEAFPRYGIVGVPILEAGSRFVSPVRYGDAVTVRTRVAWVREKTFRVEHELSVGDRRCAEGFEVRAWVALPETPGARLRALPIPPEVAAKLRGQALTS